QPSRPSCICAIASSLRAVGIDGNATEDYTYVQEVQRTPTCGGVTWLASYTPRPRVFSTQSNSRELRDLSSPSPKPKANHALTTPQVPTAAVLLNANVFCPSL